MVKYRYKYDGGQKFIGWICLIFCLLALFPIGIIIMIFGAIELGKVVPIE